MINKIHHKPWQELLAELKDNSVNMILTDIPFGVVSRKSAGLRQFDKEEADIIDFSLEDMVDEFVRVCSGSIYIFCATEQISELRNLLVEKKLTTRTGVWEKSNPSPANGQHLWLSGIELCVFGRKKKATFNEHCKNTVWKYPIERRKHLNGQSDKKHLTPKSVNLFRYLIRASSNKGDIILDPFSGTGTTAVASAKEERNFICGDKEKVFVDDSIIFFNEEMRINK